MSEPTGAETRKAVSAAVVGNVLEWYDFAVYAFVATIIAKKFFPAQDEVTALLSTFLAYGLGFVARPLGGIVIGRLGDTRGRKTALLITIFLMAAGTVLIGLLPTYETIGVLAPLLLVVARLMQGFSAGGEWGGSTAYIVEWAPPGKRGWYGSFQQTSVVGGLLLGSGVAAVLNSILDRPPRRAGAGACPSSSAASSARSECGCGARSTRRRPTGASRPAAKRERSRTAAGCLRRAPSASPSSGRCASTFSSTTCRPGPGNT